MNTRHARVLASLTEARELLDRFLSDAQQLERLVYAAEIMANALRHDKKIISCGNGGSMSDAMHFAEELSGRFRNDRPAYAALALSDPAFLSCVANDYGYEQVFARGVQAFGQRGDVLLAISTSGNSANVLRAAEAARAQNMKVIALTGKDGGALAALADVELRVPHGGFADRIQEVHIKIIHCLIEEIEQLLQNN
ncbi:MAG: D-sedoheptulose 7-phosphate isomerase [Sphingobacteriaceae bacterium]|nr:D-sedoheptulose 7-phosphate isomerase [Sphingobacteriaceae bacterium]